MKFYRHYKNKPYKFLGVAKHSETLEDMVVYETLYQNDLGKLWVRPKSMFFESVNIDGKTQPRFLEVPLKIETKQAVGEYEAKLIQSLLEKVFGSHRLEEFQGVLNNRKNFLLVTGNIDGKLVGFKLGYQHDSDTFYSWLGAVDPEFRGLGVASELMKVQHEWCQGQGFKKIQTKTKNKWREMIILNLKSGFQIIGTYTDEKGEPKLILEKKLE